MRWRISLLIKILSWFFLNLLVLAAGFFFFFQLQFRFGPDCLLAGRTGERIQTASALISDGLKDRPRAQWSEILARFGKAYKVGLFLLGHDGAQIAGEKVTVPGAVAEKLTERRGPGDGKRRGPPAGRGPRWWETGGVPVPRFILRTSDPGRYWVAVQLPVVEPGADRPFPVTLLINSDSLFSGGLFLDLKPWVLGGLGAILFSILFWFPLVRSLTRSLSQMTGATESISQGRFDVRVDERRGDELGRLGHAINRMAARLSGFVSGQKRFLGDIAHELCSPLSRIQVGLGILENRIAPDQREQLDDLKQDVQGMSGLVNELLSFSKAGLTGPTLPLERVELAPLIDCVVARECPGCDRLRLSIEPGLCVLAREELVLRALANLIRNAMRYAPEGTISVSARKTNDGVTVGVEDEGPGIPESELHRAFDPFYRGDASRSRDTGGVGLGLAIVKSCVEACQGTVTAANRSPKGLRVRIALKPAE